MSGYSIYDIYDTQDLLELRDELRVSRHALREAYKEGLRGKDIIEIGCGKGEFLLLLCEMGNNRGTGFDPGFVSERISSFSASAAFLVSASSTPLPWVLAYLLA